jgi:hypothetical protein
MKITPKIKTTPKASIPTLPGFLFSFSVSACGTWVAVDGTVVDALAAITLP